MRDAIEKGDAGRIEDERLVLTSASPERTEALGALLAPVLEPGDVVSLSGDLGAGKTRLTKGLARGLGVHEPVTSPTFNLLLVHQGRLTLNHFDLYRLDRAEELEDIDLWGTLESGGVSVVEWGDRFCGQLPPDTLHVSVRIVGDTSRELTLVAGGPRSAELARAWATAAGAGEEG